ncbi:DUF418 domain-containing protein [Sphingomonas sp.]|uniref:DUF418 domain-containing protein n=1 Tax=Sphingomonas sp. TaxID=28214 RepID=UPI0035BBEBFD
MTDPTGRIDTLDFLRGIAVMGILAANLPAFALPEAAYFSPLAAGGTDPASVAAWFATYVLVEGKMRGLFSLLFGASMLLVVERAEAAGGNGAAVHFRRMAWLFAIGWVHLYALWRGDILTHYALCGAVAYPFRRMPVRGLVTVAAALIIWETAQGAALYGGVIQAQAHPGAVSRAFLAAMTAGFGAPPAQELAREVAALRGGYAEVLAWRWNTATSPLTLLPVLGPETLATMLLGMAGLKSGFLTGAWLRASYARWAAVGLGVSLPVYAAAALHTIAGGFALEDVVFGAVTLPAAIRTPAIIGYAALGILLMRPGGWLTRRIAAAGRAAFTNYLGTSLVMTTIFYGYGLDLFGQSSRSELYWLIIPAWALMLAWSQPWLARYRYGPLEWLWRSLAKGRIEGLRS